MATVTSKNREEFINKELDKKSGSKEPKSWDEMSPDAKELVIISDSDSHLYRTSKKPILDNLAKKKKSGQYDPEKARTLWGYHADRSAKQYHKEYGDSSQKWHEMFTPEHRKEAAAHWEHFHRDELE